MDIFAATISVVALIIAALGYRHSIRTGRIADRIVVSEKKNEIARIYLQIEFICDRTSRKLAALYRKVKEDNHKQHLMNALISEAEIKSLYRDYSKRLEILTPSNRPQEELLVKLDDMLGKARIALDRAEKSFEDAEHIESLMPRNAEGGGDDV